MSIPSGVLCEIVLTIAGLGALNQIRKAHLPASLFWALGIGTITLAAFVGALVYAGFTPARPPHLFLTRLAGSVGILALFLAALFHLVFRPGGNMALLVTALAVGLLIWAGIAGIPTFGIGLAPLAMMGLVLVALWGMRSRPRAGTWLLAAVAFAALAELARQGLLAMVPVGPTDLFHLLLAVSMICFGLTARTA